MMLDGMSDSIQGSRIENLHSTEVDRQSPTGLIFSTIIGRRLSVLINDMLFYVKMETERERVISL